METMQRNGIILRRFLKVQPNAQPPRNRCKTSERKTLYIPARLLSLPHLQMLRWDDFQLIFQRQPHYLQCCQIMCQVIFIRHWHTMQMLNLLFFIWCKFPHCHIVNPNNRVASLEPLNTSNSTHRDGDIYHILYVKHSLACPTTSAWGVSLWLASISFAINGKKR